MTISRPEATPGSPTPNRRKVLCGLSLVLFAPAVIAACGDDDGDDTSGSGSGSTTDPTTTAGQITTSAPSASGLVALASVPVGGGTVVDGPDGAVLVVQPTSGQVRAFEARCTHEGTLLPAPVNGTVTCPKHGSKFDGATGAVTGPPAERNLTEVSVRVEGDQVVLA